MPSPHKVDLSFVFSLASSNLRRQHTRRWLETRHERTTKQYYVKSRDMLKAQFDAESIFFKFDDDCSGTLTIHELDALFNQYEINLDMVQLRNIFGKLDLDKTGTLDLQEFTNWQFNPEAKGGFRDLIYKVRNEQAKNLEEGQSRQEQMPFEFCIMLEYLTNKMTRDGIQARI